MPPLVSIVEESPAPGPASASGDYVWFRGPDSRPSTGALTVIEERLREHAPDVLLLESGRLPRRRLARIAHDGVTTLAERPGLASVAAGGLRDKVFRRQFLLDLGVGFGAGTRAELPVTWAALLAAERIAAAPGARCDGPPAPAATAEDLGSAYDAVFAFAGPRPEILPAMVQRELAVLKRLPPDQRRAHFAAISATLRRHGGGGAPLIARNAYDAYRALEAARAARRRVRRAPETLREQRSAAHYRRRRRAPIDENLAVFAAYWYRGYSCNPRAIYEKAREFVPDMRGVWVVKDPDAVPAGVEHVVAGTREYYDVLARGRVFVNNVNFP
ncbi:MAG TPA: CDP-glycerol glycerophosphotransferase family protein, partial [Solirubrobacter sp.]|nr:CDP-glycerol glycerophosphotransferase family protein [Solirubrobacter sp.]